MRWRGYLILPIFFSMIFFLLGQNGFLHLSDPLDFMATGLGVILCIIQIAIWISWMRRLRQA